MVRTRVMSFGSLFPIGDTEGQAVLRLIALGNDVRSALRMLADNLDAKTSSLADQRRAAGDRLYAFRMGIAHLHEGLKIVNCVELRRIILRWNSARWPGVESEAKAILRSINHNIATDVAKAVRNRSASHYDPAAFADASAASFAGCVEFNSGWRQDLHLNASDFVWWHLFHSEFMKRSSAEMAYDTLVEQEQAYLRDALLAVVRFSELIADRWMAERIKR